MYNTDPVVETGVWDYKVHLQFSGYDPDYEWNIKQDQAPDYEWYIKQDQDLKQKYLHYMAMFLESH